MTTKRKEQLRRLYTEDLWDLMALNECSMENNDELYDEHEEENEYIELILRERREDKYYTPSATHGDYSPSCPWNAPGMSISDFI